MSYPLLINEGSDDQLLPAKAIIYHPNLSACTAQNMNYYYQSQLDRKWRTLLCSFSNYHQCASRYFLEDHRVQLQRDGIYQLYQRAAQERVEWLFR